MFPRKYKLKPNKMDTQKDVLLDSSPAVESVTPEVTPDIEDNQGEPSKPPKGFVPLAALQEERAKRQELEQKLALNSSVPSDEWSDEGRAINNKVSALEAELSAIKEEKLLDSVIASHPELKDLKGELKEFAKDFPRHKIENVAKLFLVEKGLIDTPRRGLEGQTGGGRAPVTPEWTFDKIAEVRKKDPKKYETLLLSGEFDRAK